MRRLALLLLLGAPLVAQPLPDLLRRTVVLKDPRAEKVEVRKNVAYDGERKFDLYRPPNASGALPVVIFLNGIGQPSLKEWGQYTSWPRLVAARGMAAISYETSGDDVAAQTEALLRYLRQHAAELKIDPKRVALWSCSANVRLGTALIASHAADDFRAAVFYYGIVTTPPKHADLPVMVARAGLDTLTINDSIDRWVAQAVALDAPVTLITYPQGRHGFDVDDDTDESRAIIDQTLDFLEFHLTHPRAARTEPVSPAELQRVLRDRGVAALIARVTEVRKTHPNAIAIEEQTLNGLGYSLLAENKAGDAIAVFEHVAATFPRSANAQDSLSEAYEAAGRTAEAIAASERTLALLDSVTGGRRELIRRSAEERLKRLRK